MKTLKCILIAGFLFISMNSFSQWQRNINETVPTRQVHLDFHTSEAITGIGEKFNKKQFQEALIAGHVNQINIFAKCHHSWSYYPTKVGNMHPNLKFDLMGAEIEACHEIGVVCPIYYSVGWSFNEALNHPDWCMRKKDGSYYVPADFNFNAKPTDVRPWGWINMCQVAGSPYHQYVLKNIEEICQLYKPDGFWFDIYPTRNEPCYCQSCIDRMKQEGVDINDVQAVSLSYALALKAHMKEVRELVVKYHPKATVYFNSATHVRDAYSFTERLFDMNTQQELEDLPTTWGGYDKLPIEAKFHLSQGIPTVAMSGKFHKSWGEFGGFKSPQALTYEAAAMISYGASCNFGDQLHPSGEMDMSTYRNIGEAFKYVEKIEKYGPGGVPVSSLGVWLTLDEKADRGTVNMLLEMHYDFVIADLKNLSKLELLIIPSRACLKPEQANAINDWVKNGGNLIVFGEGALDISKKRFILDVGADFMSKSSFNFDYTSVKSPLASEMVTTPFLNYQAGMLVKLSSGEALAYIREPYFNRTYEHFSSHGVTPYKTEDSGYPAVVRNGNVIFFAHAMDRQYFDNGMLLERTLVKNAIDLIYNEPVLKVTNLPSSGRVSFLKQEKEKRYVAHLLYAPALQRGEVQVIEDFLPVPGVEISVDVPENVKSIYQIPGGKKLKFSKSGKTLKISVPTFTMHTGIVMEY